MKTLKLMALAATSGLAVIGASTSAVAQAEPILGQISLFATNWCPNGWAQANGALLSIQQYSTLYSLYGTYYGGNGTSNFALPNLTGRAPVGWSNTTPIGSAFGASSVTLTTDQMPIHTHVVMGSSAMTSTNNPAGASLGTFPAGQNIYAANTATPDVAMHANIIAMAGGNQSVSTQSPVLSMNWCVSMQGVYPSRP